MVDNINMLCSLVKLWIVAESYCALRVAIDWYSLVGADSKINEQLAQPHGFAAGVAQGNIFSLGGGQRNSRLALR